jgi:hypothetical protein
MGSHRSRNSTRAPTARSAPPSKANVSSGASNQLHHKGSPVTLPADIPLQITDLIERERRRLQQASAVLSCLTIAALYQEGHEEIDAGDVALVARSLIDKTISRLDLIGLARTAKELGQHDAAERAATED